MYCTIEEAWGESIPEQGTTKSVVSSNKRNNKKISQQQQFMQKVLPHPVQSVRNSNNSSNFSNSAVDVKNYSRDVTLQAGHSEQEKRVQTEKNVTVEPFLIDSENTDMYYQLNSSLPSDDTQEDRNLLPSKTEMQILLSNIDEILKRIDSLKAFVQTSQSSNSSFPQDSLVVVCNTLLGIFAGIFLIFVCDLIFRYARV